MHKITRNSLSFVATSGLLATALFILPLKADVRDPIGFATAAAAGNGGDHGGMRDEVQENSNTGYTGYSADPTAPITPCQSCYGGSGTDAQNLSTYSFSQPRPCRSCGSGEPGK